MYNIQVWFKCALPWDDLGWIIHTPCSMDSDGLCTQAQGDYACTYVLWLELFWFEYGCGEGGVSDIFVNYMYCLQTSFSGDFLVVQPYYYFVNCIPIDTNCRLKEKGDGGFFFFLYEIDDLAQIHVQSSSGIASVTFCSIWCIHSQPDCTTCFLIKSAYSIWPWTASENRLPNKYITISFSQCYNLFFPPFQVFPH